MDHTLILLSEVLGDMWFVDWTLGELRIAGQMLFRKYGKLKVT